MNARIEQLKKEVNESEIRRRLDYALGYLKTEMGKILTQLDVEHPEDPVEFVIKDLTVRIKNQTGRDDYLWEIGSASNWLSYLNTFSDGGQRVFETAQTDGCPPFTLVAISDLDWNHNMVPRDSLPAFKSAELCTGGVDDYLWLLTEEIIHTVEKEIAGVPSWRGIAGYSLAGLFALYAIYQTDLFSRVGSISGPLWFSGMKEYIFSYEPKRLPDCMYFSPGDKESKNQNSVLRSVRQNMEEIQDFYQSKGIDTVFQLNPGNYYNHAVERTAADLCWLLGQ